MKKSALWADMALRKRTYHKTTDWREVKCWVSLTGAEARPFVNRGELIEADGRPVRKLVGKTAWFYPTESCYHANIEPLLGRSVDELNAMCGILPPLGPDATPAERWTRIQKKYRGAEPSYGWQRLAELPKGTKLFVMCHSVSRSGLNRDIGVKILHNGGYETVDVPELGWERKGYRGFSVGGAGMDAGFHLVYNLGALIHGDGYYFKKEWLS